MPLVKFVGNTTPEDRTEVLSLGNDPETGDPRFVKLNDPDWTEVTGEDLQRIARGHEIVIKGVNEKDEEVADAGDQEESEPAASALSSGAAGTQPPVRTPPTPGQSG